MCTSWKWLSVLAALVLCCVTALWMGGCSSWSFADDVEAKKAEAAAARERADEALKDVEAVDDATAAATTVDPATGQPVTDQVKLAAGIAASGRPNVVDSVTQGVTAGSTVSQAAAAARAEAQKANTDALVALRGAQAAQREAEAKLAAAKVKDERVWDIGGLGIEALAAFGVPLTGVISYYFGRLRGLVTGSTQTAQVVGTARALDPLVDDAFSQTTADSQLNAMLNKVHPLVKKAILENKKTPLPGTETAIAMAINRADNVGALGTDDLSLRLNELQAEIVALRDAQKPVAGAKSAAA